MLIQLRILTSAVHWDTGAPGNVVAAVYKMCVPGALDLHPVFFFMRLRCLTARWLSLIRGPRVMRLGLFLLQEGLVAVVGGVVHFVFIGSFRAEGEEGLGEGLTGRRKANEHEVGR